jgi:HlyD family secretion protein
MTKRLSIFLPLVGVCLIGLWITISSRKPVHVDPLVAPTSSPYSHTIAATGVIEASDRNFNLMPPISGQLTRLFVKENDIVHRGDRLYQVDDRQQRAALSITIANVAKSRATLDVDRTIVLTQQANLESARAAVASAGATYEDAKQISDRNEGLHKDGIVSDQVYLTAVKAKEGAYARWKQGQAQETQAEAQLSNAEAALTQQKADLESAAASNDQQRVQLDQLTVRAPADGKILQINNRAGEYLSNVSGTAPVLFGDTGSLLVRVDVDEINASHVNPGSSATATLKGDSSRRFPLQFVRIVPYMVPKQSLTGSNSERVDVRVLQIEFRFAPPLFPVYVGQQVDVFIDAPDQAGSESVTASERVGGR